MTTEAGSIDWRDDVGCERCKGWTGKPPVPLAAAREAFPPEAGFEVKHMDSIDMYFLNRIRPDLAADAEGCVPNDRFWNAGGIG